MNRKREEEQSNGVDMRENGEMGSLVFTALKKGKGGGKGGRLTRRKTMRNEEETRAGTK